MESLSNVCGRVSALFIKEKDRVDTITVVSELCLRVTCTRSKHKNVQTSSDLLAELFGFYLLYLLSFISSWQIHGKSLRHN